MRAWLELSTRMFSWLGINTVVKREAKQPRTPLRSPWITLQEWR